VTALVAAVFLASVMGSLHCAGMCGAFVAFAVAPPLSGAGASRSTLLATYNVGRLVTYTALGALSGALGAALDMGGAMVGVQRVAAVLAGSMMIGFGLIALLRINGVRVPRAPLPPGLERLATRGYESARRRSPVARALLIGMLTTLLPCGWLYAFAITAAGTASPLWGALTMAVFWAGTLPVLVAVGAGAAKLTGALGARAPVLTTCALIGVGLWTVAGRLTVPTLTPESVGAAAPATTVAHTTHFVPDGEDLPCCHEP